MCGRGIRVSKCMPTLLQTTSGRSACFEGRSGRKLRLKLAFRASGSEGDAIVSVRINSRPIGPGHPVYLVAELSGNHNGDYSRALALVHAAADAGADAIKLQTYTPDTLTIDSDAADFIVPGNGPWSGRSLYELYKEAQTPWEWHANLFAEAHRRGLAAFSTPFD